MQALSLTAQRWIAVILVAATYCQCFPIFNTEKLTSSIAAQEPSSYHQSSNVRDHYTTPSVFRRSSIGNPTMRLAEGDAGSAVSFTDMWKDLMSITGKKAESKTETTKKKEKQLPPTGKTPTKSWQSAFRGVLSGRGKAVQDGKSSDGKKSTQALEVEMQDVTDHSLRD